MQKYVHTNLLNVAASNRSNKDRLEKWDQKGCTPQSGSLIRTQIRKGDPVEKGAVSEGLI